METKSNKPIKIKLRMDISFVNKHSTNHQYFPIDFHSQKDNELQWECRGNYLKRAVKYFLLCHKVVFCHTRANYTLILLDALVLGK